MMTPWQWYWIDRADSMKGMLIFLTVISVVGLIIFLLVGHSLREDEKELSPNFVLGTMFLIWAKRLAFVFILLCTLNTLIPNSKTLCKMNPHCVWTDPPPDPPKK